MLTVVFKYTRTSVALTSSDLYSRVLKMHVAFNKEILEKSLLLSLRDELRPYFLGLLLYIMFVYTLVLLLL